MAVKTKKLRPRTTASSSRPTVAMLRQFHTPYPALAPLGPSSPACTAGEEKCVALHTFEGLNLEQITSITPRQDYSGIHSRELLEYGVAAVKIAKLGGRFSRPVFLELDKRFKAGKKSKNYFLGFKSIDAMCKHIGISRKHFYNVINDNRSGRKLLSPNEQSSQGCGERRSTHQEGKSEGRPRSQAPGRETETAARSCRNSRLRAKTAGSCSRAWTKKMKR